MENDIGYHVNVFLCHWGPKVWFLIVCRQFVDNFCKKHENEATLRELDRNCFNTGRSFPHGELHIAQIRHTIYVETLFLDFSFVLTNY